jgi:hypothetical protein
VTVIPGRADKVRTGNARFFAAPSWIVHVGRNKRSALRRARTARGRVIPTCTIIDSSLREGEGFEAIQLRGVDSGLLRFARNDGQSFGNLVLPPSTQWKTKRRRGRFGERGEGSAQCATLIAPCGISTSSGSNAEHVPPKQPRRYEDLSDAAVVFTLSFSVMFTDGLRITTSPSFTPSLTSSVVPRSRTTSSLRMCTVPSSTTAA